MSQYVEGAKTIKKLCLILILILSLYKVEAFSKEWNGIVPCISTRSDVEKVLGKDRFPSPDTMGSYRYKKSRVRIYYERINKNAPEKDIVKKINVYPDKYIHLTGYIKEIPNFRKDFLKTEVDNKISHVNGLAYYRNGTIGFELVVQKNDEDIEIITSFGYFDPVHDCSKRISDSSGLKVVIYHQRKLGCNRFEQSILTGGAELDPLSGNVGLYSQYIALILPPDEYDGQRIK